MVTNYQDRMIEDYNDAAEAKGVDPIPTMEQVDQLRKERKEGGTAIKSATSDKGAHR